MKSWGQSRSSTKNSETTSFQYVIIFPAAIILLILIIALTDKQEKKADVEAVQTLENAITLRKDSVPEISELVNVFFEARLEKDTSTVNCLFKKEDSKVEAGLLESPNKNSELITGIDNIICYTTPGTKAGSYAVYVLFDIRVINSDIPLPSILQCYMEKDIEGYFYIVSDLDKEAQSFLKKAACSQEVRQLSGEVETRLRSALASDNQLTVAYLKLRDILNRSDARKD